MALVKAEVFTITNTNCIMEDFCMQPLLIIINLMDFYYILNAPIRFLALPK